MNRGRIREIEEEIAELKGRWPVHSVPPQMWQELEELEDELREAERTGNEESHAMEEGSGQLQQVSTQEM